MLIVTKYIYTLNVLYLFNHIHQNDLDQTVCLRQAAGGRYYLYELVLASFMFCFDTGSL